MDVQLDRVAMKALSSETRVEVLKLLGKRNHMQSELASELSLAVPTVKEHLSSLELAGLIERRDEGRKWKYYALTKKGKGVLYPEQTRIWLLLGVWAFSAVGAAVSILGGFESHAKEGVMQAKVASESMLMTAQPLAPEPVLPFIALGVFALFTMFLGASVLMQYHHLRNLGKSLRKK